MRLAASMPSFVYVGGIRMSVSTASGEISATDAISEAASVAIATTSISSTSARSAESPSRTKKLSSATTRRSATPSTLRTYPPPARSC